MNSIFVLTTGCFNLIHPGHINFLSNLKSIYNFLGLRKDTSVNVIVGLDSDERNRKLKGEKALYSAEERALVLRSIKYVDEVIIFDDFEQLFEYEIDYFVKADEYSVESIDPDLMTCLKKYVVPIVFLPYEQKYSTTGTFLKIKESKI